MKEYILNINFGTWQNQLWFLTEDSSEADSKWQNAIKEIDSLKNSSSEPIEFQNKIIEHFKSFGFIRVQK